MSTTTDSATPPSAAPRTASDLRFRPGVAAWITRHADRTPDKPAIITSERTLSYADLERRTWQVADALRQLGVSRGDRVAVLHENHAEFMPATLGILRLGAVYVPLNLRLAAPEMAALVADSEPVALITTSGYRDQAALFARANPALSTFFTDVAPEDFPGRVATWPQPDQVVTPFAVEEFDDDSAAGLFYTSGTTGLPKGAIITHGNIRSVATSLAVDIGFTGQDRPLVSLPISVSGAMLAGVLPFLHLGCTLRLLEQGTPEAIAAAIRDHRPTYMASVPTVFKSLLDHPSFTDLDLTCFNRVLSAAAPMPVSLIERFQARGLSVFVQGYGLTESCGFSTYLMPEDAVRKAGSIGKSLLYSDVRVFRDELEAAPGEIGEIRVSGPSVMAGYWRRPDERPVVDGWLCTGDLGYADEEGYLYVTGRLKDMIVTGGFNVYPAEVENVIYQLPEVAEAAVIGVPDDHWGERVVAVVRPHPGTDLDEAAVLAACAQSLADYKRPKEVLLVRSSFPINATGKVMKAQLRESLVAGTLA
ncbi:AMP-binding protein [Nocardioides sp. 616]|uniref:class I adenylate-forming enzyme family protein n=1 Tax=Nocardioides sp. 616 TaxID=2268090 RepID=UPI000CE33DB2|nr:AMP-binding protein [Nocardioides sp. 616]